jgi:hypothetical protein
MEDDAWEGEALWKSMEHDDAIERERNAKRRRKEPEPEPLVEITIRVTGRSPRDDDDRDTDKNPYPEDPAGEGSGDKKIAFHEESHSYALLDERGIYPDLIISGSKVAGYMEAYQDALRRKGGVMEAGAILRKKSGPSLQSASSARMSLQSFRGALAHYFLSLCEGAPLDKPMTYAERSKLLRAAFPGKEFGYFLPSATCIAVETWFIRKRRGGEDDVPHPFDLSDLDQYEAYQELYSLMEIADGGGDESDPKRVKLNESPLFQELFRAKVPEFQIDETYIKSKYGLPAIQGTALHAHIEHRFLGLPREECLRDYPLHDPQDLANVDMLMERYGPGYFKHLEYRVGSFRHKVCGSIDAIREDPETGEWTIFDWKRSNTLFELGKEIILSIYGSVHDKKSGSRIFVEDYERRGVFIPQYGAITKTSPLYKYMMQMATYRKLCVLEGRQVSKYANIVVVIPNYPGFRIIELDLSRQCKTSPSPIEHVEWIFQQRERHLKRHFHESRNVKRLKQL